MRKVVTTVISVLNQSQALTIDNVHLSEYTLLISGIVLLHFYLNNFCFVPGSRNPFVCTKETEKSDRKRERAAKTTHFVDKFISRRRAVISDT